MPTKDKSKKKMRKRLVIKDEAKPEKTPAGFVRGADGKLKKKKIVVKDTAKPEKTPAGFIRGADGKLKKKKIVIKNQSANASALSSSASNPTPPSEPRQTEFPDDILSLIKDFPQRR